MNSALVLLLLLCGEEKKPLTWAADQEGGAPYIFLDKKLGRVGFEVDIIAALARELGRPIEFKQYPFDNLIPGLIKGDFDFAMNGLEVTEERKKSVRFSTPYYVYRQQLVIRKEEKRFGTLLGLKKTPGAVAGTLEASQAERLLDAAGIIKRIYPSPTEAYADLAIGGRIDGVFLDLPMALSYAQNDPRLVFAGKPTARGFYALAFRLKDEALAKEIDTGLDRLRSNGKLREILVKWDLWDESQEQLMPGFLFEEEGKPGAGPQSLIDENQSWTPRRYLPLLLEGAWVTAQLTVWSFALALILALPLALARMHGPGWLKNLALIYIEFFRGIPVLLLLFFLYFGLPGIAEACGWKVSLALSPFAVAAIGLGLNYSAYEAENFRSGIQSVGAGQWEAAASLGMGRATTFRRIILPQAMRSALPSMTNDLVGLFKDTSIASAVALVELNKQYQILAKSSLKFVEIGLITAALYLILSVPLGRLARALENKFSPEKR
ncbi:MAG: transporter substrate-binding domain-containing protein [Gemmataceae bacterium]|nr:transporter substrate-binding domain-containing protein [Gemmataceae bacterium]